MRYKMPFFQVGTDLDIFRLASVWRISLFLYMFQST